MAFEDIRIGVPSDLPGIPSSRKVVTVEEDKDREHVRNPPRCREHAVCPPPGTCDLSAEMLRKGMFLNLRDLAITISPCMFFRGVTGPSSLGLVASTGQVACSCSGQSGTFSTSENLRGCLSMGKG